MAKIFHYSLEDITTNLVDKEYRDIKYIKKKTFKKAVEDGLEYRIVGRTALRETSRDDKRNIVFANDRKYQIDSYKFRFVKGYIPVGDGKYLEYVGLPIFIWLIPLLAVVIFFSVLCFGGILKTNKTNNITPLEPNWSALPTETGNGETVDEIDTLIIDLPNGYCQYNGELDSYSGNTSFVMRATINDGEHILVNQNLLIDSGSIAPWSLDFLILDVELVPGFYDGNVDIIAGDGSTETRPLQVIIRQSNNGSVEFSYTHDVFVDTTSGVVNIYYQSDEYATHDTAIQVILLNGDQEYLLAQSGRITRGQEVTSLTLNSDMAPLISSGVYTGYIRLYFDVNSDDYATTSLYTDIEVFITIS